MNLWERVASLFLPQIHVRPMRSMFDGDPEAARRERPFPTSSQIQWMQSHIATAITLADGGDLSMASRLSNSMRRDATFAGLMSTRAGGLTRLPKRFRGSREVVAELESLDRVGLFDRVFPPKELELLDADGINLGVGVGEMLPIPGQLEPIFVRLDPEFLRYRWSEDRWYYQSVAGELPIRPGDGRWVLHLPGGYQQPWNGGLFASLGRAFIAKEHAYLYRENYSGKLANPARVAYSPAGASETQTLGFFRRLMAWGLNTVFSLPPGWEIKLLESNGVGYDVYKQTIESADREFMIGLAGQIVTVTGGAGFANADIHASIRSDLIQGDGDALAATINAQGLAPVVNRLFGSRARGVVAWDTKPPADLKAQADTFIALAKAIVDGNAALAPYGQRINAGEMATRFNVPVTALAVAEDEARGELLEGELLEDGDQVVTPDEAARELAERMTEHGIRQCEHGSSNRCRLCGIERVRSFVPGADGEDHTWNIAWRAIPKQHLSIVRAA